MTEAEFLELVEAHTSRSSPPLCPELRTREAKLLVPAWEAAEKLAGGQVEPPFWAYSWAGSQALARFILDDPVTVRSRVVLDLGCGNALGAMAAAMAGAARAIACDIDPAALWMARMNGVENGVSLELEPGDLLVESPPVPPVEVVLAGDLFYARVLAGRVEPWLREAAARGAVVLVGDPGRAYLPRSGLRALASYDVPATHEIEGVSRRRTLVYRLEG